MNIQEKIELVGASIKVADFWGVEPSNLLAFVSAIDKEKTQEWNKIGHEVIAFGELDIDNKAKALGFEIIIK